MRELEPWSGKALFVPLLSCATAAGRAACPLAFGEVGVKERKRVLN